MKPRKSRQFNLQPWKQAFKGQSLIRLLAFSLTVTVLLGSVAPSHSQTATPSTPSNADAQQEVVEDIKQAAERHIDAGSEMQTQTVVNAFKDNPVGLAEAEILEIYETEYLRLQAIANKAPSFWEQIRPQVGWIAAIFFGLLAIFRDTLNQWVTGAVEAVGEGIYAQLAGNRLLRGIALRRYQQALLKKHQELHIPFRANRPLDMAEVYIPLNAESKAGMEQIDADRAITRYKRLMVTGPPGGGKSMLLKHIALAYGMEQLNLPERPIPVLVDLHRLSHPELTQATLIQILVEAFSRDNFPKAERFIRQSLHQGTLLLLLDGLDEVNSDVRPRVVQEIKDLLDTYEDCRVVITCRTAVYRDEFVSVTEQTLKVAEFSDQQIRRFLKAWEPEMPEDKSIEQLLETLRNRPRIVELARNPLLLTIIAHLYSNPDFVLPYSRTQFYQESTAILLGQWDKWRGEFNQEQAINKRRVLQHLALLSQTGTHREHQDRRRMDRYTVLQEIQQILPSLNLDPDEKTEPILQEIVERSGLLLVIDGGAGYKFSHLTLQEYFAAEALQDNADGLITRFQQAPDEWREVVKLWCGFGGNSTALIQAVYQTDAITGFECLADAQEIEPEVANTIIETFKAELGTTTGSTDPLVNAFGAVAANARPRGKAVFVFLEQCLNSPDPTLRAQAAEALAKTNLPAAAKVLGAYYRDRPEVRLPLTRMGDLAVTVLLEIGQDTPIALNDLFTIGTPEAASALVHFLWGSTSTQDQQYTAAWYLSSLLPQLGIEDALQVGTESVQAQGISITGRSRDSLDWIWHPFPEPKDDAVLLNIRQVAYLIAHSPTEIVPDPLPALDPRLVVPLCAIYLKDQVQLPTTWPQRAETLLEQQTQTPEIADQVRQTVRDLLSSNPVHSRWQRLLSGLPPQLQLDLLHRLIAYRPPNPTDWRYIFRSVRYDFRTEWQYKIVLLISAMMSIVAIMEMGVTIFQYPDSPLSGLLGLAIIIILIFWDSLRRGIEQSFEPNTFLRLGIFGPITLGIELRQLFHRRLVWPGIVTLFNSVNNTRVVAFAFAFAFAVNFAFAFAGAGAFAVAFAVAFAFAFAFAFAVTFAVAGAVADADAFAVAFAGAGAFAVAFAFAGAVAFADAFTVAFAVAFTVAFAVAFAFAGAVAGAGLGAWYRLKSRSDEWWPKFLAILAFPWFCWFPIVTMFSTLGLHRFLPLTWAQTVIVALSIFGICTSLWWHGQQQEARARNPLQGILPQALSLRA